MGLQFFSVLYFNYEINYRNIITTIRTRIQRKCV